MLQMSVAAQREDQVHRRQGDGRLSQFTDGYLCGALGFISDMLWGACEILEEQNLVSEEELQILKKTNEICEKIVNDIVDRTDREEL